ncbi:unnamed protein product [Notodromas monacha]|uniref:Uncharacterized protein n=1 Tax=Notodromas monacha TaxID=399045 RepID=A0A7R9BK80_9CRUS|nr:unnamed protein product [Notodromas monacha]CAG0915509.1 unnamed protein product [Notodromas monacha]
MSLWLVSDSAGRRRKKPTAKPDALGDYSLATLPSYVPVYTNVYPYNRSMSGIESSSATKPTTTATTTTLETSRTRTSALSRSRDIYSKDYQYKTPSAGDREEKIFALRTLWHQIEDHVKSIEDMVLGCPCFCAITRNRAAVSFVVRKLGSTESYLQDLCCVDQSSRNARTQVVLVDRRNDDVPTVASRWKSANAGNSWPTCQVFASAVFLSFLAPACRVKITGPFGVAFVAINGWIR